MDKSPEAFRTISEVAEALETPAHVLRFWETRFPQIRPVKRAGGRRYYRPSDLALLAGIRRLLHEEGMTIRGVQKILREQGVRHVAGRSDEATAEEEALISAMTSAGKPHEAVVTRLTPREADQASVEALEAEARASETGLGDASGAGEDGVSGPATEGSTVSATVIAFPADAGPAPSETPLPLPPNDSPKETAVPAAAADPRQIAFPGFEPAPSRSGPEAGDLEADDEEAPFLFEIDQDEQPEPASASISQFVAAQPAEPPAEQPPGQAAEQFSGPHGAEVAGDEDPEGDSPPLHTVAARLRALPPGRLHARDEPLRSLIRRVGALRKRLDEAQMEKAQSRPN